MVGGVIERSIYGYPGLISTVFDPSIATDIQINDILRENPMVKAIMLRVERPSDANLKIANSARLANLPIGIEAPSMKGSDGEIFEKFDFVRIRTNHIDEETSRSLARIRNMGIRSEVVYTAPTTKRSLLASIEEEYKTCSPCDCFIAEIPKESRKYYIEELTAMGRKYGNLVIRFVE